jgi:hypothetical protein
VASSERFWASRLRWRLRGAWQWPAFAALTVADGLILHLLPPTRTGVDLIPALIIATFGNLFLIGAVAPWVARRLAGRSLAARERRPAPGGRGASAPPGVMLEVLRDRAAVVLLAAGALGLVAAGLATRPLVISETEATEENARAVRDYVLERGDEELRRNIETANTIRLSEGYFRTCIARDDRRRYFCLFVDTNEEPPTLTKDPSTVPNAEFVRR